MVGRYLKRYVEVYGGYEIRTLSRVIKTELESGKWRVWVRDGHDGGKMGVEEFDHVIVSSGFFGIPKIPKVLEGFTAPVIHSSKFRNPRDVVAIDGRGSDDRGTNIHCGWGTDVWG